MEMEIEMKIDKKSNIPEIIPLHQKITSGMIENIRFEKLRNINRFDLIASNTLEDLYNQPKMIIREKQILNLLDRLDAYYKKIEYQYD